MQSAKFAIERLPPVRSAETSRQRDSFSTPSDRYDPANRWRVGGAFSDFDLPSRLTSEPFSGAGTQTTLHVTRHQQQRELAFDADSQLESAMLPPLHSTDASPFEEGRRPVLLTPSAAFSPVESEWTASRLMTGSTPAQHAMDWLADTAQQMGQGTELLDEFLLRVRAAGPANQRTTTDRRDSIPDGFVPWWQNRVVQSAANRDRSIWVGVDGLVDAAIAYSPYVQGLFTEPHIQEAVIVEEYAAFDWKTFLETTFNDVNEPIGNTLTTGNNEDRFREHDWSLSGGVRRRTLAGAELEVSQEVRRQSNNSTFLDPNPQANSRLEVSFIQPLLNGAGRDFNRSRVILASIDSNSTDDQIVDRLQVHLVQVVEAYWELYRARAELVQRDRVLNSAIRVLANLEARGDVDALQRQILRARAAVAKRQSEIARAENSVRVTEARLRLLVNDPRFLQGPQVEYLPSDAPLLELPEIDLQDGLATALMHRPDISVAIREMNASLLRLGVAKRNILPKLDLVLSTRVDGVEGESAIAQSFGNQFAEGRPSYSAGFQFEIPIGNRLSKAQYDRRKWESERAFYEFQTTVEQSLADVETAIRELDTTRREMLGKYAAMVAATNEVEYLEDRWRTLPGIDDSATLLLEDLLESQERLADEEGAFVRAQVGYSLSYVEARREIGTLLRIGDSYSDESHIGSDEFNFAPDGAPSTSSLPAPEMRRVR